MYKQIKQYQNEYDRSLTTRKYDLKYLSNYVMLIYDFERPIFVHTKRFCNKLLTTFKL